MTCSYRSSWFAVVRLTALPKQPIAEASVAELTDQGILAGPELHVVDTLESISLAEDELNQADKLGDLPSQVLDRLITDHRDRVIVATCLVSRRTFERTLIFAINRRHVDRLGERFRDLVPTRVLHGASPEDRAEVLKWFEEGND
jgi:superfamily II DNA or RNA helicase